MLVLGRNRGFHGGNTHIDTEFKGERATMATRVQERSFLSFLSF
jgi:hypothetical protein